MQKSSFFSTVFLICSVLIAIIFSLLGALPNYSAHADAAPGPDPTISGVGPYQPQKTNVQMLSETVLIEVHPTNQFSQQTIVQASFTMQNQGQTEEKMQVIFPLTNLDGYMAGSYDIIPETFVAKVNRQSMPISEITTPVDMTYSPKSGEPVSPSEGKFYGNVLWAAFDATFPVRQKVILEVEYKMKESSRFTGIEYILETGAGWYGNILSADIILRLPYPVTEEIVKSASPGYIFSNNEIRWKMKNFEPTRKDNMFMHVVNAQDWERVLELRSKLEQNPNEADTWSILGDEYARLALFSLTARCEYPVSYNIVSQHFVDLTVEAYEKAIAIRPEWGDVHLKLASILWLGNENVEKRFRSYSDDSNIQSIRLEDPYVQHALSELQLAWSYGLEETSDCRLLAYMNSVFPELKLTPPAIETITPIPATQTPSHTPTAQMLPKMKTVTSASPSAISKKDSSPIRYDLAVGFIILLGVVVYLWFSMKRTRN